MRLVALEVHDFAAVEAAHVQLGPGLNVLYGPNDLGKSTLAHALRAALLLQPRQGDHQQFRPWHSDRTPSVTLEILADDGRTYRLEKTFGAGTRGSAMLSWSNDGRDFQPEAQGREVDERLRELLGWGLAAPGGRGGRGLPGSFLSTVLLGRQAQPGTVFERDLGDDASEAGRERLSRALEAFAQDPLFKAVLERAQAEVDLAYTQGGKLSTRKDSPFRRVRDRIAQLTHELRTLEDRVLQSNDVRTRLVDLDAKRDEAAAAREEASRRLARVQSDLERAQARAAVSDRLARAEAAWTEIRAKVDRLATLQDELHDHEDARPAALATAERNAELRRAADRAHQIAAVEHEHACEGGDAEDRLTRQSLQTRRVETQLEHQRAHELVQEIEAAQRLAERLTLTHARVDALLADLSTANARRDAAEHARRHAESERRLFDGALALRRVQEAEARRDEAQQAATRARARREQAAELGTRAAAIVQAIAGEALPDAASLRALAALEAERRVAEARLGGGLSLTLALREGFSASVQRDGEPTSGVRGDARVHADRRIALALPDVGEIVVTAGDAKAVAAAETLARRWRDEAEPLLARVGVDDLAALAQRCDDATTRGREAEALQQAARELERQASDDDTRAAEAPHWDRVAHERASALAALDRAALASRAEIQALDEDALRKRLAAAEAHIAEAATMAERAGRDAAAIEGERNAAERDRQAASEALDEAKRRLGQEPDEMIDAAQDRVAALEGKLEAIDDELARLDAAGQARRERTAAELERAAAALAETTDHAERAGLRLAAIDREIERSRGAIEVLQAEIARLDEPAAHAEVQRHRDALAALPAPACAVQEIDLARARDEHAAAEAVLRDVEAELHTTVGALQSVGGEVMRERAEQAREALEDARRQEHEVQLDYEGWRLLVETLRETETTEGRHLGDALVEPIRRRFTELTQGRYGGLALGPDLQTHGLHAAGGVRALKDLSEGLQEQLATLLRLTIAQQLDSALVLDDHLTQTDPSRIAWFRRVLREAAEDVQILVLTCRPTDYLEDDELPDGETPVRDAGRLRAIDLARIIRRAGTAPPMR